MHTFKWDPSISSPNRAQQSNTATETPLAGCEVRDEVMQREKEMKTFPPLLQAGSWSLLTSLIPLANNPLVLMTQCHRPVMPHRFVICIFRVRFIQDVCAESHGGRRRHACVHLKASAVRIRSQYNRSVRVRVSVWFCDHCSARRKNVETR